MNKVELTGRTTKELELRSTQGGTNLVRFTLAVDRRKKDDGADFIGCIAYGNVAEVMARYVKKGHKIGVVGHIRTGKYEKDGKAVYTSDVVVDEMEFLEKKEEPSNVDDNAPYTIEEVGDLPF